jgi:uncharacterized membrane protein
MNDNDLAAAMVLLAFGLGFAVLVIIISSLGVGGQP